jgi:hypothetical protein
MIRLLADENFNGDIVRGLLLRRPDFDIVRVQDVGLSGSDDAEILGWAAEQDRILLSHDRASVPDDAYERIKAGDPMPGVFLLGARFPVGPAIQEILLIEACSEQWEWSGLVAHLPL